MSNNDRTISLEERMDAQLREFGYTSRKIAEDNPTYGKIAGATAVIGGGGAAAYYGGKKLRNAVINKAGVVDDYGNMVARKGMYKEAGKKFVAEGKAGAMKAGQASVGAGKGAARTGLRKVGRKLIKAGGQQGGLLRKAGQTLTKAGRSFEADQVNLITHLAARIADLELEMEEDFHDFARAQEEDRTWQRGAAGVAGGAAIGGAAYGGKKLRDKVIGSYGSANQSLGKMTPRKGMYAAAGQDAYGVVKKKAGVYADTGMDALKKAKGNLLGRFAKKTTGFIK